ncbi:MAG: enoyl-CoA hydratase-related protein [Acidimicrobiales bacterium]
MSSTDDATVQLNVDGGVATVAFNRPEHLNGITNRMARELYETLSAVAADSSVMALVLTGNGSAFCPGADLRHYSSGASDETLRSEYFQVPVLLHEMPQVTIAAINGACAGAGMGYALACDFRYVSRTAKLNTAFLDVAVAGDMGIPWMLPRIVGNSVARELSFFPGKLTADEALDLGLVHSVLDPDELLPFVLERAQRLAGSAPLALRAMKAHYVAAESMSFADFIRLETEDHTRITQSQDCKEAFAAFVEKRPAEFKGI